MITELNLNTEHFVIDRIKQSDLLGDMNKTIEKKRYNVNNLGDRPDDYFTRLSLTNMSNWVNPETKYITIDNSYHLNWIKDAHKIGSITKRFPLNYKEELQELLYMYRHLDEFLKSGFFVRTDHCSMKTGIHGVKKYVCLKEIIESIVTSDTTHAPLAKDDTVLKIYLVEYLDINRDKEFRIFVYNNCITCISQQFIYEKNTWLLNYTAKDLEKLVKNICEFHKTLPQKPFDYTYDLVLKEDNLFYFIEMNGFGRGYSAGSALYHWEIDKDLLENTTGKITLRFVV